MSSLDDSHSLQVHFVFLSPMGDLKFHIVQQVVAFVSASKEIVLLEHF